MTLLLIFLFFSVALNLAIIFGVIRRRADEDMLIIRLRDGLGVE